MKRSSFRQKSYEELIERVRLYRQRAGLKKSKLKSTSTKSTEDKKWQLAVRLKDDYTCQKCGIRQDFIHTHHVATRSRRPDLKHEVSNGKCLCFTCHEWVHNNPKEATELGLLSIETYELVRSAA